MNRELLLEGVGRRYGLGGTLGAARRRPHAGPGHPDADRGRQRHRQVDPVAPARRDRRPHRGPHHGPPPHRVRPRALSGRPPLHRGRLSDPPRQRPRAVPGGGRPSRRRVAGAPGRRRVRPYADVGTLQGQQPEGRGRPGPARRTGTPRPRRGLDRPRHRRPYGTGAGGAGARGRGRHGGVRRPRPATAGRGAGRDVRGRGRQRPYGTGSSAPREGAYLVVEVQGPPGAEPPAEATRLAVVEEHRPARPRKAPPHRPRDAFGHPAQNPADGPPAVACGERGEETRDGLQELPARSDADADADADVDADASRS